MSLTKLNSSSKKGMSENKMFLFAMIIILSFTAALFLIDGFSESKNDSIKGATSAGDVMDVNDKNFGEDIDADIDAGDVGDDITDVDDVGDDITDVDDVGDYITDVDDVGDYITDVDDVGDVGDGGVDVDDTSDDVVDSLDTVFVDGKLFLDVGFSSLGRCGNSVNGKVQTFMVDLELDGFWGLDSKNIFALSCGGGDFVYPVSVHRKGGGFAAPYSILNGTYRVAFKCGRTGEIFDYSRCGNLSLYLDVSKTIVEPKVDGEVEVLDEVETVYHNPYLDKFRGLGLRKADLDINWLCPSCVPAVNNLVIGTEGVKSRSLGYKQDVCYVIYDPNVVTLERVMEVAGAGGDLILISDTELT